MLKTNCGNMCRRQATPFSGSPSAFKLTLIMDWCRKHGFLTSYGCIGLHIPCHIPVNSYCTEEPSTLMENVDDSLPYTVELQWLKHLWNHGNMFEKGVVRANEC